VAAHLNPSCDVLLDSTNFRLLKNDTIMITFILWNYSTKCKKPRNISCQINGGLNKKIIFCRINILYTKPKIKPLFIKLRVRIVHLFTNVCRRNHQIHVRVASCFCSGTVEIGSSVFYSWTHRTHSATSYILCSWKSTALCKQSPLFILINEQHSTLSLPLFGLPMVSWWWNRSLPAHL
jgi:hypothetical protein